MWFCIHLPYCCIYCKHIALPYSTHQLQHVDIWGSNRRRQAQTIEQCMASKMTCSSQSGSHPNLVGTGPGSEQLLTSCRHQNHRILNQFCAHSTLISLSCRLSRFTFFLLFLFYLCLTGPHSVCF